MLDVFNSRRTQRRCRYVVRFDIGGLLLVITLLGCRPSDETLDFPSERTITPTVNVLRIVEVGGLDHPEVYFGQLMPQRESRLGFRAGGEVKSIQGIGSRVSAGNILAELDLEDLEQQQAKLKAQLEEQKQGSTGQVAPTGQPRPASPPTGPSTLEQTLSKVEEQIAMGRLKAPFDAIVAETYVDQSGMAPPSSPVVRIVEDAAPMVKVALPRAIANRLQPGKAAQVLIGEQSVEFQVEAIAIEERPVGSRIVWLHTDDPLDGGAWSFGQTVATSFRIPMELPPERASFWLPQSALTRAANGLWSVYVVTEPAQNDSSLGQFTLTRKIIRVHRMHDEWVVAQGDLRQGALVVANGLHRVVAGQAVRIEDVSDSFAAPGNAGEPE